MGQLFSGCPPEYCRGNIVGLDGAQERAWKRREGGRAQLLKEWHRARAQHKQIKIKWIQDDKSNSTKPWSQICKLNEVPRGDRRVPSHYQKTEEWVVSQWLGWSSHSLAYEFTQLTKTSHTILHGTLLCDGPYPVECASLWIWTNPPLTYHCVSYQIFAMRHESLSFIRSWSQAPWVLAGLKSWERGAEG